MTPKLVDSESEDEEIELTEQHMAVLEPVNSIVETWELDNSGMFTHKHTVNTYTSRILS